MNFRDFNSLYIFERIAHHLSFKEAAQTLHLTPGALSHRMTKLEEALGFPLFVRQTRQITLTPEGERLYRQVRRDFASVCHEIENIGLDVLRGTLDVGCTPTFAQHWLVPRLLDFYQQWPELSLHIRSKGSRVDFNMQPADLWIDYGNGDYQGQTVIHLLDEVLMPVCSPAYAEKMQLMDDPARLADCLLLHDVESIAATDPQSEWRNWLTQTGLSLAQCRQHYSFNHYDAAIMAARSGLGVAMGRYQLAQPLVSRGELVFPFDTVCDQGLGYYVVTRQDMQDLPKIQVFCQWLQQQATSTALKHDGP